MFLVIHDNTKHRPVGDKARNALALYYDKFPEGKPDTLLVNPQDAAGLTEDDVPLLVSGREYISLHNFYVGTED